MDNSRSHSAPHDLEQLLEEMRAALSEEADSGELVGRRLESAQALFSMIERVREFESASEATGSPGSVETGPFARDQTQDGVAGLDSSSQSVTDLDDAETLGRFQIIRQLGEGGFGLIFLARDPKLDREVAIKIPRPEAIVTEQVRERFLTEARAAAMLSHPNIVPVFEIAELGPICFIVSQYVEGCTLSRWLEQRQEPVDPRIAAHIMEQLADAVQHAHRRGVLHRDLKPSNVLFDEQPKPETEEPVTDGESLPGIPMITDFGLAKLTTDDTQLTRRGDVLGTPSYMAPEQAGGGRPVTPAADIYSLGAILYCLLTGQKPHQKATIAETLRAVQESDPLAPRTLNAAIPRDLESICLKCLEKSPDHRYASAHHLGLDLGRFLAGSPVEARRASAADRLKKWATRNPALATSLATLLVVLVGGLITVSALLVRSNRLYAQAEKLRSDAISTTSDLQNAVDEMLLALANMPEIEAAGFESVRHRLLERSNAYYSQIASRQPLDPEIRRQRLATLMKLARVKSKLGDHGGAVQLARDFLEQMPNSADLESPGDPVDSAELAVQDKRARIQSLVFLANEVAGSSADESQQYISQALELGSELSGLPDRSDQDIMELALMYKGVADACSVLGQRTESIEYIEEALALWGQIDWQSIEDIQMKNGLGKTLIAAAVLYSQAEEKEKGQRACQQVINYYDTLVEQEEFTDNMLFDLARAHRVLCWYQGKELAKATESANRSEEILVGLIARHPLVPSYRKLLMGLQYSQGLNFYFAKQYDDSATMLESNIEYIEDALGMFPDEEAAFLARLGDSLTMLGIVRKYQDDQDGRLEVLRKSESVSLRRFELSGGTSAAAVALAGVEAEIAKCLFQKGGRDDAIAKVVQSNQRLAAIIEEDPQNGEARRFLSNGSVQHAEMLADAGAYQQALDVVEPALALGVRHSEFRVLHQMVICNYQLGHFEKALEIAKSMSEFPQEHPESAMDIVRMLARQISLLKELDDSLNPAPDLLQQHMSQLATYGTAIAGSQIQAADDPEAFLSGLEDEADLADLVQSDEFQSWVESR